jgi:hypothetical protein
MKQFIYPIFLLFISIVLPTENFAQSSKEIIEPGKGCGKIQLGKSLSEIKPILGEGKFGRFANWVEYQKAGLLLELLPSSEKIWSIFFVVNPKIWGDETYTAFQGSMPKNVSLQTSPEQLFILFGKPVQTFNDNTGIVRYAYDGIEYNYREGQLIAIKVFNSTVPTKKVADKNKSLDIQTNSSAITSTTTLEKGTIEDCKNILSERCRGYFLLSTIEEIRKDIELSSSYNRFIHLKEYKGKGIVLSVEPSTGRVIRVDIDKWQKKWKPDKNIKWDEDLRKVMKKLGEGEDDKYTSYPIKYRTKYPDYILEYRYEGLHTIYFESNQPYTTPELAAKADREVVDRKAADALDSINKVNLAKRIAFENSPAGRAEKQKEMEAGFEGLLRVLEAKNEEGMRLINSSKAAIAMGGHFAESVKKKLDKITASGYDYIRRFEEKYSGMITKEMADKVKVVWTSARL